MLGSNHIEKGKGDLVAIWDKGEMHDKREKKKDSKAFENDQKTLDLKLSISMFVGTKRSSRH